MDPPFCPSELPSSGPEVFVSILAKVDGDAKDPRRQLRIASEQRNPPEDVNEDLLREILGLGPISDHAEHEREDPPLVNSDERIECLLVARHKPRQQDRLAIATRGTGRVFNHVPDRSS